MWSFAYLDEAMTLIQRKVPFHPLVCVKPNFVEATLDSEVVREIEQSLSMSFPLRVRFHGDAVNKEVIGIYHKHSSSNRLIFNLQNPNLAPFNALPVILCCRFRDRSEHGHVGMDVGVRADAPNRVGIAGLGTSYFERGRPFAPWSCFGSRTDPPVAARQCAKHA